MPSTEVFISKKKTKPSGLDIKTILARKETKGDVGIEIEVEGTHLPGVLGNKAPLPAPWTYHQDHSLRGPETGEYVLAKPIPFKKVPEAIKKLWECFKANTTKIKDSNRTSVHVHLNAQNWYLDRLCAFVALYYIVEVPLTAWCGEHRVGNLFCLRAIDAPAQVSAIKNFLMYNGETKIPEVLHYSALNVNALAKYGSLEVRTLRGVSDPVTILDWIEILERLYNLSGEFKDPRDICENLSSIGPLAFFDEILGSKASVVRSGSGMNDAEIAAAVYEGVRIAQDLCYCRDWSLYAPMKLKPDPFSRNMKTVAQKMQYAESDPWAMSAANVYSSPSGGVGFSQEFEAMLNSVEESWQPSDPEPDYDDEE